MNLAIDIGNTRTKIGIFKNADLLQTEVWETTDVKKLTQVITNHGIKKCIFSSTAHLGADFLQWAVVQEFIIKLDAITPIPIVNQYATPHTLGKDRLAAVIGAFAFYPQQMCLIVDAGTCLTYEFLTAEATYLGGNIAPGLRMRGQAMHQFTAKLPLVKPPQVIEHPIGNSTTVALQNGAAWGTILEIQGVIDWCNHTFGSPKVILTGGDADFFHKNLKTKTVVHRNLVLHGLNKILNYNVEFFE